MLNKTSPIAALSRTASVAQHCISTLSVWCKCGCKDSLLWGLYNTYIHTIIHTIFPHLDCSIWPKLSWNKHICQVHNNAVHQLLCLQFINYHNICTSRSIYSSWGKLFSPCKQLYNVICGSGGKLSCGVWKMCAFWAVEFHRAPKSVCRHQQVMIQQTSSYLC